MIGRYNLCVLCLHVLVKVNDAFCSFTSCPSVRKRMTFFLTIGKHKFH